MTTSFENLRSLDYFRSWAEGVMFRWGGAGDRTAGLDCLGYAAYVRELLKAQPLDLMLFSHIYESYPTLRDMPQDLPLQIGLESCDTKRSVSHLDLLVVAAPEGQCLATYVEIGELPPIVAMMGLKGSRLAQFKSLNAGQISAILDPARILTHA
jgi:hypothetical protein